MSKKCENRLHYPLLVGKSTIFAVAPRVGAWIEILDNWAEIAQQLVAPRVGAWIEIYWKVYKVVEKVVAPRVGAWIEIGTLNVSPG